MHDTIIEVRIEIDECRSIFDIEAELSDICENGWVRDIHIVKPNIAGEVLESKHHSVVQKLHKFAGIVQLKI